MKKLILFSLAAAISFGAVAQNKHGKKHKGKGDKHASHKKKGNHDDDRNARWDNDRRDDDDRRGDDDRRDDDYRRNGDYRRNDDNRRNDNNRNDRYSNNNLPRKVSDAFQRDYPNASNVNWTKDRGIWSANFKNGGLFGGNKTVSYRANGQRLDGNRNTTVYGRNDRRTQQSSNNPIYDKVFGKKQ